MLVIVLNMGFQKCWYKQSEDSNRNFFIDTLNQPIDKKNTYHICMMSMFLPFKTFDVVITDFRQKWADEKIANTENL